MRLIVKMLFTGFSLFGLIFSGGLSAQHKGPEYGAWLGCFTATW